MENQLTRDTCHTVAAVSARFFNHTHIRERTSLSYDIGELMHLTTAQSLEPGGNATDKTKRKNAVSYDQIARLIALLLKTVQLVSGKSCDDSHGAISVPASKRSYTLDCQFVSLVLLYQLQVRPSFLQCRQTPGSHLGLTQIQFFHTLCRIETGDTGVRNCPTTAHSYVFYLRL